MATPLKCFEKKEEEKTRGDSGWTLSQSKRCQVVVALGFSDTCHSTVDETINQGPLCVYTCKLITYMSMAFKISLFLWSCITIFKKFWFYLSTDLQKTNRHVMSWSKWLIPVLTYTVSMHDTHLFRLFLSFYKQMQPHMVLWTHVSWVNVCVYKRREQTGRRYIHAHAIVHTHIPIGTRNRSQRLPSPFRRTHVWTMSDLVNTS